MIKDLSINNTLLSLEGVLHLDYGQDHTVEEVLDKAKADLENSYGIILDKSVYEIQAENQLSAQNIDHFLLDLTAALQQASLYLVLGLYQKNIPFSLADVNYLGFARDNLITALKYLMDKDLYVKERYEIVVPITTALDNVQLNYVKRIFVIMLMLDRLGVYEGATVMAHLLYIGGLMQ